METKTRETKEPRTADEIEFDRYVDVKLPAHLRNPMEGMQEVEAELEAHRQRCRQSWNAAIALGFSPGQISGSQPWPRTAGGRPIRIPSSVSVEDESQAAQAIRELQRRGLHRDFDPALMIRLEEASRGVYCSQPISLRGAIESARLAAEAHDAAKRAAVRQEEGLIQVRVLPCSFERVGPLHLAPGDHSLTPQQLEQHREWEAGQLDRAKARGREFPDRFGAGNWPVLIER